MTSWDRAEYDNGSPVPQEVMDTLHRLLAGDHPVLVALRQQIPFARAVSGCSCGCPSVGLEVDRALIVPTPSRASPVVSGWYDDQTHDVVLFIDAGYLSSIDLNYVSDDVPTAWPDPALLTPEPVGR
jgi:hypothetical protein